MSKARMSRRKSFIELHKNVKVQMLIEYTPYAKGDIVTMDSRKAKVLIDTGTACKWIPKK